MDLRRGDPEDVGMSRERIGSLRERLGTWVNRGITPALVALAAQRGVVVLHEAFGTRDTQPDGPPVTEEAVFPLASLTKTITAVLALILVEDGVLGLNRPV